MLLSHPLQWTPLWYLAGKTTKQKTNTQSNTPHTHCNLHQRIWKRRIKRILQIPVLVVSVLAHFSIAFGNSYTTSAETDPEPWDPLVWSMQGNQSEEIHLCCTNFFTKCEPAQLISHLAKPTEDKRSSYKIITWCVGPWGWHIFYSWRLLLSWVCWCLNSVNKWDIISEKVV